LDTGDIKVDYQALLCSKSLADPVDDPPPNMRV